VIELALEINEHFAANIAPGASTTCVVDPDSRERIVTAASA
jgi:hypothetical protein